MSGSPGGRSKFCGALEWCVSKSWKNSGQVITDWDVEPAAAFNRGEDSRDAWAGVFAADMDPVGAAQGNGAHRILGEIVAQFQLWIVEEACQSRPDSQGVAGGLARWPIATLLVLWPSLGGHWVEVWFLNWLRPRLSVARGVQVAARVGVWFVGGIGLAICMGLTAMAIGGFRLAQARLVAWGARFHRHRTGGTSHTAAARATELL